MLSLLKLPILILCLVFYGAASLFGQRGPAIESNLASEMVVVGEQTLLTVWLENVTVIDWPDPPNMAPLTLKKEGQNRMVRNGQMRDGFRYLISAFEPGIYPIPAFEIRTSNGVLRSKAHTLRVFPVSDLTTQGLKIGDSVTPYLTGVFLQKRSPYLGETQDVEVKLYLAHAAPDLLRLADGNVIQMEKENLAAWRFTTTPDGSGFLDYDGHRFLIYTYRSSINAIKEGPLTLGPGTAEIVLQRRMAARIGFATTSYSSTIQFPTASLTVRPLPKGAPPEFAGAVGSFTMDILPLAREIEFGTPLTIDVSISGTGNINQFPGPELLDPDGQWKQFQMIAKPSGSERRSSSGTVEFSQVIRPIIKVPALPPYRFAYFDPLLESYRVLESPVIPLTITGEPAADVGGTANLAFLTSGQLSMKSFEAGNAWSRWAWQLVPLGIVLILLVMQFRRSLIARKMGRQPERKFTQELEKVASRANDRISFYREAAQFLTARHQQEGFEEVFETRDEICFRPDITPEPVEAGEKKRVLDLLKTLAPLWLFGIFFFLQIQPLSALPADPKEAKAAILKEMSQDPAPEHFYNLALCEKALGESGQAALWAYRFQLHGGDATDLMLGLPGSRAKEPEGTEWVAIFPKWIYLHLTIAGLWFSIILILVLRLSYYGKLRTLVVAGSSALAALGILVGTSAWFLYPEGISFEPLQGLAVVTSNTPLRVQPFEGGESMRENLTGSLCKVTKASAGWAYITLPSGLSGWIREQGVEPIHEH